MPRTLEIALLLGVLLNPLAGLMACLITYQEARHHHPDRSPAVRAGMEVGLVTTALLLALSAGAGFVAWKFNR